MGIVLVYFNPSPQKRLFFRFLPYCFATPRNATGHGKGEVDARFAAVAVFSTPPSFGHLPYILRCKTQGRRIILSCVTCLFFPPIARRYPVILRDTTGGGVSYFCSTIVFNPLALRALPLYSLTETQGERIERGILCFGIRIVLCISLLLLHDTP